jgi:hypothetical protein
MEPLREIIRSWGAQARKEFKKELNALTKTQRVKCIKLFRQGVPLEEAKKRAQEPTLIERLRLPDGTNPSSIMTKREYSEYKSDVQKGLSSEEAYAKCEERRRGPIGKHFVDGLPLKEYCKRENLNYKTILSCMYTYNLSIEKAIETAKNRSGRLGRAPIYWYKGKPVSRVLNAAQYSSFATYLDKYDCLVDEAVEYAIEKSNKGTGFNNLKHKMPDGRSFRSACIAEGLKYERVLFLVSHKKMSYEAAIQHAKTHKGVELKHVLSSGESLRQACNRLGVAYNCTLYYLKGGKTCDEALKYYCRLKGVKYE